MRQRAWTGWTIRLAPGKLICEGPMHRLQLLLAGLAGLLFASAAQAQQPGSAGFSCRRATGLALGVVHAPGTWERLGKNPTFVSWSPVVGGACAIEVGAVQFSGGTEIQFMYHHHDPSHNLTRGWITLSPALTFGGPELRAGVVTPVGLWGGGLYPAGAGAVVDWLPGNPRGARDGLEARLTGFWVSEPNVQLMVLYVVNSARIP